MIRSRTASRFRPTLQPDQSLLVENRKLVAEIDRRKLLRGAMSLGALSFLTGCDISDRQSVQSALRTVSSFNDRVQELLFNPNKLAPTYSVDQVVKPPRFNAYYEIEDVKPIDLATWKLELAGLISDKRPWTLDQVYAFPEQEVIIKHICVEGWDYIGQWSGPNLRNFLTQIGADLTAKYVAFHGNDDYMECIDMPSALHPQTILATKYAGEPITDPYGAPLRLRTAVKLGFKNPKWIRAIEVTNTYPGGFWEDQGFNWFAGL
ncbi:MAG: molybdopterin-binding protein [Rhizobiales bacterium 24-66-13]|jgi:DMSO/TMAO reductase YedYZ molybdopterin-dependent catalytic subunit|uniref:molybdopterin-dependent oxidoreductase n=1 Tax=Roseixanthobacter finlandensis TaxID=3119922 RepID=UPI000BD659BB|nr:MAG: molybdopterin-binding protein [Rhizobiales bacterium 12-66-7]OYY82071.1 MAG: molybdopterin-binding protein [Rhizobiales bacterium 35-66-30]OYZ81497.1 MAG: molybdopterin-binding protein [Rhizobiales bacterium 24-66-13]OZB07878.1 MAG: molybdopterin-binding protein [Rhizobiales bacterium 39-66-18]HQS07545.1 molybdopterin-dependent oxidoreductase [Xanthobacteraceae bacterium]